MKSVLSLPTSGELKGMDGLEGSTSKSTPIPESSMLHRCPGVTVMRPRVSEHKDTIAVCWPVTLSVAHVSAGIAQDKCADMPESWKKVYIHWNNAVGQAVMAANAALNVTAFRQVIVLCRIRMLCSILWERREFGEKYNPRAAVKILLGRCIGTVLWGSPALPTL